MDYRKKWKLFLNSGNFRRKVKKYQHKDINNQSIDNPVRSSYSIERINPLAEFLKPVEDPEPEPSLPKTTVDPNFAESLGVHSKRDSDDADETSMEPLIESEMEPYPNLDPNCDSSTDPMNDVSEDLSPFLRNWSIQYNIRQQALKPLLQKLNQLDPTLPTDPRRLLYTPRIKPSIIAIGGGEYWHQGIGKITYFL